MTQVLRNFSCAAVLFFLRMCVWSALNSRFYKNSLFPWFYLMDPSSQAVCGNNSVLLGSPSLCRRSESLVGSLTLFIYPPCCVMRICLGFIKATWLLIVLCWFGYWLIWALLAQIFCAALKIRTIAVVSQWVLLTHLGESKKKSFQNIINIKVLHKELCKKVWRRRRSEISTAQAAFPGVECVSKAQIIHALNLITKSEAKFLQRDQFFINHCADRPNELCK